MAVAVELQAEWRPGGDAQIAQTQFFVDEVVVVQTLALIGAQIGLAADFVVPRFVARARFHGRQDVHQSGSVAPFSEYARHQIFLANVALAHVFDVNPAAVQTSWARSRMRSRSGSANRG